MHRRFRKQKNNGFTLVELLVVVAVIAILSGIVLSILNSTGIQAKGRDAQRKADLGKIQTALEVYFADHRAYPVSGATGGWEQIDDSSSVETALETDYISSVPTDPSGETVSNNGPCGNLERRRYNYRSDGTYYILTAMEEVATSNDDSVCDSLNNWGSNCSSYSTGDYCYGVENP